MRYLVLSDIHSNLEALEAVLRASAVQKYDAVLVLGDLVGYGADPNAVVERVRGLNPVAIVRGNHDKVAAGLDDADDFNPMARTAANWTRECADAGDARLPPRVAGGADARRRRHRDLPRLAARRGPVRGRRYRCRAIALPSAQRPLCLFGHTHVALCAKDGCAAPAGDRDTSGTP